jgi:hypothetical protein
MENTKNRKMIYETPQTLSDYMHEMELYSTMNLFCIAEIKRLSGLCGTTELDRYIENSMSNIEQSIMWIKAARSFLENM